MVKRQKKTDAAATLIIPGLYLGPCSSASSQPFLTSNTISTVLSVGATPSPKVDGVTYHRLSLTDTVSSSVTKVLDDAADIIDAALKSDKGKGRIFVHCSAGISRSPTVVIAYLMKRHQMSLGAALGHVGRLRPQIHPNSGFLHQLRVLEVELTRVSTLDVEDLPRREKDRLSFFQSQADPKPVATSSNPT